MDTFYWCFILSLTSSTLGSEKLCSIVQLPSLVLSQSTEPSDINCVQYSFCTASIGSDTDLYISDTSITVSNYTNTASSIIAVIPSSLSAALITDNVFGTNSVTIFDFLGPPKLLESSTILANTLVDLVKYFNWTRIAVIADASYVFYLRTAEQFYKMSPITSKLDFLQVEDSEFSEDEALRKIEHLNFRIIVLSLRSVKVHRILNKRLSRVLKWPKYAWITHSVSKSGISNLAAFEGVIELQVKRGNFRVSSQTENLTKIMTNSHQLCKMISLSAPIEFVDIYQWVEQEKVLISNYSTAHGLGPVTLEFPIPSDLPPQYVPITFIILYYVGIGVCFVIVTLTMTLYIYFRKEPAIKATSISLSMAIFIGCYMMIFYLTIINTFLLPSYHTLSGTFRNFICVFRVWLHGLGFPIALIMSTLFVKLLRVYRIFNFQGKISRYTSSNVAITIYALLLTSPNALICLIWSSYDPYISTQREFIRDGYLFVNEECVSKYTLRWLLGLLVYLILISIALTTTAILTRKIQQRNFKDTKKISALSFMFVLTISIILSYWYTFRIIKVNVILVHAVLQFGHYFLILECQGFLFAPKLYPILKNRLMKKLGTPNEKSKDTSNTNITTCKSA